MISVTEDEINCAGLLDESGSASGAKSTSLVFMRSLENINSSHDRAGRYIDLKPNTTEIDNEAQGLCAVIV